jgi:hypothetical protein
LLGGGVGNRRCRCQGVNYKAPTMHPLHVCCAAQWCTQTQEIFATAHMLLDMHPKLAASCMRSAGVAHPLPE